MNIIQKISIQIIEVYQKYLSRDHSIWAKASNRIPHCRYIPSCSEYTKEAIIKKGFLIGSMKGFWRILRCNPLSKGGYDPVDKNQIDNVLDK